MRTQLKGVYASRRRRKDGKAVAYWYLRGFGALRPLPGDEGEAFAPGTPAFMRAYNDAISAPIKAGRSGTMKELTHDYTKSADYTRLAPRTKADLALDSITVFLRTHRVVHRRLSMGCGGSADFSSTPGAGL